MTQGTDTDEMLARLVEDASYFRPDLFAVYGIDSSGRPYLGWGMQFRDDEAIYYQPGRNSTCMSTSAEQILRTYQHLGTAGLNWLND